MPLFFICSKKAKIDSTTEVYPSVVEIIFPDSVENNETVLAVFEKYDVSKSVYQWKNHLVIYDVIDTASVVGDILATISELYPEVEIKHYEAPFYVFDRKSCDDNETVEEWDNIIMTANLVDNPNMQQEYMDYHAAQAEQWPEVIKGFCNANFQQLLVFRNDRQLMLIISIPKGENLDELNPRTTENNPRVDEWNAIMAKYQEGIVGVQPGEVWVVFAPIYNLKIKPEK